MKIVSKVALCVSFATFALMSSFADTEVVDGITWIYTVSNGKASVGSGSYSGSTAVPKSTTGAITIPSSLGGNPVTSIGYMAFEGCSGLTSVTIPDSVTSIGNGAFYGCSGLTSVTIPDSVASIGMSAFCGCSGLTSVKIGYGVTSIDECAFEGCSRLTSVTIPASVTSIGKLAFYGCGGLLSFVVGDGNPNYKSVNGLLLSKDGKTLVAGINGDVTIPDSVTSIWDYAFSGCSGLTSVTIPNSVTNIESYSFGNCSGLTSVTIPDSVASVGIGAFVGTGLRFVKFGKGLRSLAYEAFSAEDLLSSPPPLEIMVLAGDAPVSSLDEVEQCRVFVSRNSTGWGVDIPGIWGGMRIEYIDEPVFTTQNGVLTSVDLRGTTDVTIPDYVTAIGPGAFSNRIELLSVTIPNSVTNIAESAFWGCISLSDITVPDSVQSIGYAAFSGCSGLTSVTIPDSVTSIRENAFSGCTGLRFVSIPTSVVRIGSYAFSGCNNIREATVPGWRCGIPFDNVTNLTISAGTTSISGSAFYRCSRLTSVTIPGSVTSIGEYAFKDCSGLTSVTIPDSVTSIGKYAFWGCSGLTSVTIPDSVTSIEEGVFDDCSGLTSVTIPDSVTSIGEFAFRNCSGLTSITIPNSVTEIGAGAFYGCSALTSITIPDSVTSIGEFAFRNCSGLASVTIPDSVTSIGAGIYDGCTTLWKKWYKALEDVSQESALPPPIPDPAYAITNIVADRSIAAVSVNSDCAIDEFVLKDGKVYDCVLYISNTADEDVTLTLPSGNEYKAFKGARPLTIPANSQHIITITRVADRTFLVSREELETLQ